MSGVIPSSRKSAGDGEKGIGSAQENLKNKGQRKIMSLAFHFFSRRTDKFGNEEIKNKCAMSNYRIDLGGLPLS